MLLGLKQIVSAEEEDVVVSVEEIWKDMAAVTVCSVRGVRYCIGTHLAELMGKETFNLYGSLKRRGIAVSRASDALVEMLVRCHVVLYRRTSVSLIELEKVFEFVEECQEKKRMRNEAEKKQKRKIKRLRGTESDGGIGIGVQALLDIAIEEGDIVREEDGAVYFVSANSAFSPPGQEEL